MASPVMIDIPGVGNVEAKNAASEKTLQEILKILDEAKKNGLVKKNDGKEGGSGGSDSGSKKGDKGDKKGTGGLGAAAGMAAGQLINLTKSSALLIQEFANVGDSMTAAAGVFNHIPVVGGVLATVFGAVAGAAEKSTAAFQKATSSGANFGGSINQFSSAASAAGMTMEQFAGVVAANGEAMMMLGGTTADGAKRFAQLGKEMRNSKVGAELYGLGMTTAEVNNGMASYIKMMGNNGSLQGKSTKEIAAASGQYLKELDGLAKITGQTREEKMKEQEALQKDAQFRAATAHLDADQKKEMQNFITSFPKEQQAAVKDMIATGNITSDAAVKFNAQMGGTAQEVMKMGQIINSGGKVSKQQYDNAYKNAVGEAKQRAKSEEFKTMGQYAYNEFGESVIGVAELAARDVDGKKKALTAQEKAAESQAAAMEKNKQDLAALSNSFQMALANSNLLPLMMSAFKFLADLVQTVVVPAFTILGNLISGVADYLATNLKPVFEQIGTFLKDTVYPAFLTLAGVVVADIIPVIQDMGAVIAEYVWPALQKIGAVINEYVTPVFEDVATFVADNLTPILLGLGTALIAYGAYLAVTTAVGWLATGGLTALAGAAVAAAAPILAVVAPVVALVGLFVYLYKQGWSFGTAVEALQDNFMRFRIKLDDVINGMLTMIPNALGGISKEEAQKRKEINEATVKELDEKEKSRDAQREATANERSSEEKKQKRAEASAAVDKKIHQLKTGNADKLEAANKKEEAAKAKEAEIKNYDDPIALLQQEATQQKSGFIKDKPGVTEGAEATKKTMEAKADQDKAVKEKEAAAKEAAAKESGKKAAEDKGGGGATPAQESPTTLLASLNTKMDQLIKINKDSHAVSEKQLSVQKNLSQDMYA